LHNNSECSTFNFLKTAKTSEMKHYETFALPPSFQLSERKTQYSGRNFYQKKKTPTHGCESRPLSSKHNSQLQATQGRHLGKIQGKTKRHKNKNQTIRMGLGIIPLKEIRESAQLTKFGQFFRSRDSSVRLATSWTVRGSNSGDGRDFPHPSRPALRPTQLPIQWILGLSRG